MPFSLLRSTAIHSLPRYSSTAPRIPTLITFRMASSTSNIVPLIINGQEIKSPNTFEVKHPRTREVTSVVHAVGRKEV